MEDSSKSVLVVGEGGTIHTICWKLSLSPHVSEIYVSSVNIEASFEEKVILIPINFNHNTEVVSFCIENDVYLVIIASDKYLANGLADDLANNEILCFGPKQDAAKIGTDKIWSKNFMDRHDIPSSIWGEFTDAESAKFFVENAPFDRLIIKTSDLVSDTDEVRALSKEEAYEKIDKIFDDEEYEDSIIIEEVLEGKEISVHAFTDGYCIMPMLPSELYKFHRDGRLERDSVGAHCPSIFIDQSKFEEIYGHVLYLTMCGFLEENIFYIGILHAFVILTDDGAKVLEFSCTFADTAIQSLLPLLKSDLFELIDICCNSKLFSNYDYLQFEKIHSVAVVLLSENYPELPNSSELITGIKGVVTRKNTFVFYNEISLSPDERILAKGAKVLTIVNLAERVLDATTEVIYNARQINFRGKKYKTDIGFKAIPRAILTLLPAEEEMYELYPKERKRTKKIIQSVLLNTKYLGAPGWFGGFSNIYSLKLEDYEHPIIISSVKSVGNKFKAAIDCYLFNNVGFDTVAVCVNDIIAQGAKPRFFSSYLLLGNLYEQFRKYITINLVEGFEKGCKQAKCSMSSAGAIRMSKKKFDDNHCNLAGFVIGIAEKKNLLPRLNDIKAGDIILGLRSNGIHNSGHNLIKKILKDSNKQVSDDIPYSLKDISEVLTEPTRIYMGVLKVIERRYVKSVVQISDGGLLHNIPKALPDHLSANVDFERWGSFTFLSWLASTGNINKEVLLNTFNCGIGMILICSPTYMDRTMDALTQEEPVIVGKVIPRIDGQPRVFVNNFEPVIGLEMWLHSHPIINYWSTAKKKVAVLISGSGTNLQALINATQDPYEDMKSEIVLVISNKPGVEGLKRAEKADIKTEVIKNTDYVDRETFEAEIHEKLLANRIDFVCLAGFMRILSSTFVEKWKGRLINIHPSLLPMFKGPKPHEAVLAAGVRITGCTVHFVEADVDAGAIIEQKVVKVLPNDTVETLEERVKAAEDCLYPLVLKYLAHRIVYMNSDGKIQWKKWERSD